MKKNHKKLFDVFEELSEGLRNEEYEHHDVIEYFKEFIDDTLRLQVEFELSKKDIKILEKASIVLNEAYEVKIK